MRVLIASGAGRYADPWHPFPGTSARLADVLAEAFPGAEITIDEDLDAAMRSLADVDLLVVNAGDPWRGDEASEVPPAASIAGLAAALERGIGVLAMHCAAATLRDYPEWAPAIGAIWMPGVSFHPPHGPTTIRGRSISPPDGDPGRADRDAAQPGADTPDAPSRAVAKPDGDPAVPSRAVAKPDGEPAVPSRAVAKPDGDPAVPYGDPAVPSRAVAKPDGDPAVLAPRDPAAPLAGGSAVAVSGRDEAALAVPDLVVRDFDVLDERYCRLQRLGRSTVLAEHESPDGPEPTAWVRTVGRSRVAVDLLGHDERSYDSPGHADLLIALARWAVGLAPGSLAPGPGPGVSHAGQGNRRQAGELPCPGGSSLPAL